MGSQVVKLRTRGRRHLALIALFGATATVGVVTVGRGSSAAQPADGAVAEVAGTTVSSEEFQDAWRQTRLSYQIMQRPWPDGGTEAYASLRDKVLGLVIRRRVLALQANERGIRVSDGEVKRSLKQISRDILDGSAASLRRDAQAKRMDEGAFVEAIRAQIVERKLFLQVTAKIDVARAAARTYYEAHLAEFRIGMSREVVFVAFQSERRAKAWIRSISGRKNRAVETHRVVVERDRVAQPVWNIVAALRSNTFSAPVRLSDAWYVLQPLAAVTQPRMKPFAEVETDLRYRLLKTSKRSMFEAWVRQAVAQADIRYAALP